MRTLDEAIAKYQEKAEYFKTTTNVAYALELKQLAEWLEELKAYREIGTVEECRNSVLDIERAYNKGYADGSLSVTEEIRGKAIDDFANLIKQRKFDYIEQCLEFDDFVDLLAKQLKECESE